MEKTWVEFIWIIWNLVEEISSILADLSKNLFGLFLVKIFRKENLIFEFSKKMTTETPVTYVYLTVNLPCIETAGLALASVKAPSWVTDLSPGWARVPEGADDGLTLATQEWVSHHPLQADAGGSSRRDDALRVDSALRALALGQALSVRTLLEAALAPEKENAFILRWRIKRSKFCYFYNVLFEKC